MPLSGEQLPGELGLASRVKRAKLATYRLMFSPHELRLLARPSGPVLMQTGAAASSSNIRRARIVVQTKTWSQQLTPNWRSIYDPRTSKAAAVPAPPIGRIYSVQTTSIAQACARCSNHSAYTQAKHCELSKASNGHRNRPSGVRRPESSRSSLPAAVSPCFPRRRSAPTFAKAVSYWLMSAIRAASPKHRGYLPWEASDRFAGPGACGANDCAGRSRRGAFHGRSGLGCGL